MFLRKNQLYLVPLLYLIAGICFILTNPPALGSDMFFYYSIGRKYSMGEVFHALNGYWAPLLPWLLALVFKLGIFWKSLQWINLAAGLIVTLYSIRIAGLLKLSKPAAWFLTLLNAGLSLAHQIDSNTPDFLSVACFIMFVVHYYENYTTSNSSGWLKASVFALLLVFCKVFYFYFIVLFLIAQGLYGLLKEKKQFITSAKSKFLLKYFGLILIVYMLWVTALSVKYDRFVFSATGSYNSTIITPHGQDIQYYVYSGLVIPKSDYSLGQEDPTYAMLKTRNPFETKEALEYQFGIFAYNFKILSYLFSYFSYFKWLILLIPIALLFFEKSIERDTAIEIFLMGTLILFGYFLLFYEERYVLPVLFCFIVASFYFFDKLGSSRSFTIKLIFLIIPFIAFAKNGIDLVNLWKQHRQSYEETMIVSNRLLDSRLFEGKRIASAADVYGCTYINMLTLESTCKYYGELGMFHSDEANLAELKKYKIEYLFYFGCGGINKKGDCIKSDLPFYLKDKKIIYSDPSVKMNVYKML